MERYQTYEIGTRTFFIDRWNGLYDVGYSLRYKAAKTILAKGLDTPADCNKIILQFLDETTRSQFTHRVVQKLFSRAPKIASAKL